MAYEWYLFALDDVTHEFIKKNHPDLEKNLQGQVLCKDGKKRDLYQYPYDFVAFTLQVKGIQLKFKVFKKELPGGAVVKFDPKLFSPKRKLIDKVTRWIAAKHPTKFPGRSSRRS